MSETTYRPLTPKLRSEINETINRNLEELNACKDNVYVMALRNGYEATRGLINSLPDGYPVPMRAET